MATRKTSNQKKDLAEAVVFNDDERRDLPSASSFGDYELCPGLYNLTKDLPDEPNPDAERGSRAFLVFVGALKTKAQVKQAENALSSQSP